MKKKTIKVMDAKIPFKIEIRKKDVKCAIPGDMDNCVVAQAIRRELGELQVCVGRKITSILKDRVLIRFMTPNPIAKNLAIFDKTGCWSLPEGSYSLKPPPPSYKIKARIADTKRRRHKMHRSTGKAGKPARPNIRRMIHHSRISSQLRNTFKTSKKIFA